jgi:hypothetical protein
MANDVSPRNRHVYCAGINSTERPKTDVLFCQFVDFAAKLHVSFFYEIHDFLIDNEFVATGKKGYEKRVYRPCRT